METGKSMNTEHMSLQKKPKRIPKKSQTKKKTLVTKYVIRYMVTKLQDLLSQFHTGLVFHRYKCTFYHT